MKNQKASLTFFSSEPDFKVKLAFLVLLLFLFWNIWLPSAQGYLNTFSPTLQTYNVDFFAYYRGGQAYLKGIEPYVATRDGQPYIYPPTFIPLLGQLARLDYDSARTTWALIYTLIFTAALALLLGWLKPKQRTWGLIITALIVFISYPVLYYIRQGQMDLVVASFSFASLVFYMRRRDNLSALCLVIATLTKLNPLFFLITYFVFFRDWKYLLRFGVILLGMVLLSTFFFPLDWYRAFFMEVIPSLTKSTDFYYNQSLLRFFAGDRFIPRLLTMFGLGSFTLLAAWLGRRYQKTLFLSRSQQNSPAGDLLPAAFFMANALVTLLFSGSAWIMSYVWFILPVAPILLGLLKQARPWPVLLFCLGVAVTHARLANLPVLNAINMIGASLCLLTLLIILVFPSWAFIPPPGWEKNAEPVPLAD